VAAAPAAGGVFHLRPGRTGRPVTPFRPAGQDAA
jgi:hypothetical protein